MPTAGIACPWCSNAIAGDRLAVGVRVRCPRCTNAFTLRPEDLRAAAAAAPAPGPAATTPAAWFIAVTVGGAALLLLMAATVGLVLLLAGKRAPQVAAAPPARPAAAEPTPAPAAPSPPALPEASPEPPKDDPAPPPPRPPARDELPPAKPAPPELKPDPPAPRIADLPPDLQDRVNKAIDRGAAFLQKTQKAYGSWTASEYFLDGFPVGLTSLCGLTLLECGLPADDAHVRNAAAFVRKGAPGLEKTYDLALAILFLDRLAEPQDKATIRSLALRLTAGQTALGGWTYSCPVLAPEAEAKLLAGLERGRSTAAADGAKAAFNPDAFDSADNSNTQFAILGMWTARRHGVPTERVLALVNRRFRASQAEDGRWGYYVAETRNKQVGTLSTPSMTAAGLLGLAVGRAVDPDPRPDDAAIEKGMKALGDCVGVDRKLGNIVLPRTPGVTEALDVVKTTGVVDLNADAMGEALDLYFLWSVERVGVLFNRGTIGGKEWYPWGARLLVDDQNADGGWGKGGSFISTPTVDTCFALLFLKRANLARDLSTKLEFLTEAKPNDGAPLPVGVKKTDPGP